MIFSAVKTQFYIIAGLLLLSHNGVLAYWHEESKAMMGTDVTIKLEAKSKDHAIKCSAKAFNEINRIEQLFSTYKADSEVSRINQLAGFQKVKLSSEVFSLIKLSVDLSKLSQGAFDITYESIGYQYNLRKKSKPSDSKISQLLDSINYQNIQLDYPNISFKKPNVKINLGGIAKGYAIEKSSKLLKKCGIREGIISAGGDSKIIGNKHGKEWVIGIQHPRKKDELALRIPLSNISLSTSGDYERFYFDNGKRIHHIINPKTGKPTSETWSASVIGDNATFTDALSTSIFVLGTKKGLELINSLAEVDAIIIDSKGKIHYSNGLDSFAQR